MRRLCYILIILFFANAAHGQDSSFHFTTCAKDIDDSIANAATPHFNRDFSHRIWTMKEYDADYTSYAKDILCPVLVIAGKRDFAVGPGNYKSWQFKNMHVVLYDGAHFSFLEEPTWFADTVFQFLRKNNLIL
ncbi:MAG: alpha/beta hydrolase [Bacteroidota bacterium]|nr:alpha/beta hydrolase [Bacteroidota bacterium]MDP4250954.1 alpha/beta hydrolase [Bacteroidota bacterium]